MRIIKQDAKTEKVFKNRMMIFVIIFFVVAYCCAGQIERFSKYTDKPEIISLYPSKPLIFVYNKDTIFLSIFSDSINPKLLDTKLYAFYPKNIKNFTGNITIGYEGIVPQVYKPILIDSSQTSDNYVEYIGSDNAYYALFYHKYTYISFGSVKQYPVMDNRTNYFQDFYKLAFIK